MSTLQYLEQTDAYEPTQRFKINDNFYTLNLDKMEASVLSTDATLGGSLASDSKVPSQKAVYTAIHTIPKGDTGATGAGITPQAIGFTLTNVTNNTILCWFSVQRIQ